MPSLKGMQPQARSSLPVYAGEEIGIRQKHRANFLRFASKTIIGTGLLIALLTA